MPTAQNIGEAYPGVSQAPPLQIQVPSAVHGIVASVPASGNVQSSLINTDGWPKAAIGVTSSQAGQIEVQRYLDDAGLVPQGAALTAALTAATAGVLNITDGVPFAAMKVMITNTGASAATLTNLAILLAAA